MTAYRVLIKAPTTNKVIYTRDIRYDPDSAEKGGHSFPSLLELWHKTMGSSEDKASEDEEGDFEICISDNTRYGKGGGRVAFDMATYSTDGLKPGEVREIERER